MKTEFTYPSQNGITDIHAIEWAPEEPPKAVLQLVHGMVEFIDRYDDFANFMTTRGFVVVGNDHLGHGQSVRSDKDLGYFHNPNGNECVIGDIHTLRQQTAEKYPDIPYFILGHSMGSFLARQYIELYSEGLQAAIIMGTGWVPPAVLTAAKSIARIGAAFHGWGYVSKMLINMSTGSYNKPFEPARTPNDWLTKDEAIVDAYCANPLNNFPFTVNAYYHMFRGLAFAEKDENIKKIPSEFPILLASGQDDPVGGQGAGVKQVYDSYLKNGITSVDMKLYPGDRHEILNELDRAQVYEDMASWLESKM